MVAVYRTDDPDATLTEQTERIVDGAADLQRHTLGLPSPPRSLPDVHDIDSYLAKRVERPD